ncbi:MAG: hypothetical protein WA771_11730 [Chthoniobacterales bacterium]
MSRPLPIPASGGTRLQLGQPWNASPDPTFRPGDVEIRWSPRALHVTATLTDGEIFTEVTSDNQRTWELGDVFEMFILPQGHEEYVELHVVPTNHRTQLHFPAHLPGPRPKTFESRIIDPADFESQIHLSAIGWRIEAAIPARIFDVPEFACGQRFHMNFARYDATRDQPPVLSSTARHPVIDFHRIQEWTDFQLENGKIGPPPR